MLRSRGRSAGSRVDQGIFCPGTWLASMTARARRVSSWTREFQPRASPSQEAMARAWPRAGLLTDAAVQCREWNRRDWPGADSSSCSQRGSGGPAGTGPASGCGSRGRRFILATPANDSWCQRDRGEVGGAEVRCPSRGSRGLESGLQPAVAAVAFLQRPGAAAGPARAGLVPAGEVVAAAAHAGIQGAPGTARRAAAGGARGAHGGGKERPSRRRGMTAGRRGGRRRRALRRGAGLRDGLGDQELADLAAEDGADHVQVGELDGIRVPGPQAGHLARADDQAAAGEHLLQLAGLPDAAAGGGQPEVPLHDRPSPRGTGGPAGEPVPAAMSTRGAEQPGREPAGRGLGDHGVPGGRRRAARRRRRAGHCARPGRCGVTEVDRDPGRQAGGDPQHPPLAPGAGKAAAQGGGRGRPVDHGHRQAAARAGRHGDEPSGEVVPVQPGPGDQQLRRRPGGQVPTA